MPKILAFAQPTNNSSLRVQNKSATKAEIILYAGIGQDWWGDGSMISAKQFNEEIKKLDPATSELTIRINSPGGDVFDGIAIYNRIKQLKMKKIVYIDGLAASISSIIALAGDEIVMGDGALYMIHLPWTMAMGNRMEIDSTVNLLMDIEEQMIGIYAKRTSMSRAEIKMALEATTWMGADEAIEKGFVDKKMDESLPIAASAMESKWFAKKPKTFKSQTDAITSAKEELRQKVLAKIKK